jgi:tetratricopeptide (TPR) repeat protein
VIERTLSRCAGLAEGASRLLTGGVRSTGGSAELPGDLIRDPQAWLAREEIGLVALVTQGCRTGIARLGVRLALALAAFFELGTRYDSWRQVAAALRAASGPDATVRAFAFYTDGVIASELDGQPRLAIELLATAASQLDDLGEHRVRAYADIYLSSNYHALRDYPRAASSAQRALRAFEELDDQQGIAYARLMLGIAAPDAEAVADLTLSMEQFRRAGHTQGVALATQALGSSLSQLGRHREAAAAYLEALATIGPALAPADEAALKLSAAQAFTRQGRVTEALPWAEQAMAAFSEIGHLYMQTRASHAIAMIELSTGRRAEAVARLEDAARIYNELGDAFSHTRALRDLSTARQATAGGGNAGP